MKTKKEGKTNTIFFDVINDMKHIKAKNEYFSDDDKKNNRKKIKNSLS